MNKIDVLVVDDHPLFREGISASLKSISVINSITNAQNGKEAIDILSTQHVDLILMDIKMPVFNGIETTDEIRKTNRTVKILALSMLDDKASIIKMLSVGVNGYLTKNCSKEEIQTAIDVIFNGERYFSSEVSNNIISDELKRGLKLNSTVFIKNNLLSEKEIVVLKLICQEYTNIEIANILKVSEKAIEARKTSLYQKTGCKNLAGLVKLAYQYQYVV